jgi:hypothetical protein
VRRLPLALIAILGSIQIYALAQQFRQGFRLFGSPPVRVPFSWDMFAPRIERCSLKWNPPLEIGGRLVADVHQLDAPFEWFPVWDRIRAYQAVACFYANPPTRVSMVCFDSSGAHEQELECR